MQCVQDYDETCPLHQFNYLDTNAKTGEGRPDWNPVPWHEMVEPYVKNGYAMNQWGSTKPVLMATKGIRLCPDAPEDAIWRMYGANDSLFGPPYRGDSEASDQAANPPRPLQPVPASQVTNSANTIMIGENGYVYDWDNTSNGLINDWWWHGGAVYPPYLYGRGLRHGEMVRRCSSDSPAE